MSIWQIGLLMWSVAGFAMVTLADVAMREDDGEGLLFGHETKLDAIIGYIIALVVFVAWPAILIFGVKAAVSGDPIEGESAPLRLAPQPEPETDWPNPAWMPPADHEELLCRMIRLRLMKDPRLKGRGPPHRWPRAALREAPEATLVDTVRAYLTLRLEGLSPPDICRQMTALAGGAEAHDRPAGLRAMVRSRLVDEDPAYLALGPGVLGAATGLAVRFARSALDERLSAPDFPQPDWVCEALTVAEVEREFEGLVFPSEGRLPDWQVRLAEKRREWTLLSLRIGKSDHIHRYQAPDSFGGVRGLAIVRAGTPIDYIAAPRLDGERPDDGPATGDR